MDEMMQMGGDDESALECLKEIKQLMDSRLGDKLAPSVEMPEDAKGVEVSSVKVMGDKEEMSPEEMEELKKVRAAME